MDFLSSDVVSGLLAIILLDLVLAGDNAIVIAMAASRLPKELQNKAIFWGTFGAIAVRFGLTAIVVYLLKLPGLLLVGGLVLLPIAWNLLRHRSHDDSKLHAAHTFWQALRTIIVADALMGLDNVLAIAGASKGHLGLVITGLLITVPLVVWGSTLILKLLERFPLIIYIGAAAIAWTSARMISSDHLVDPWFDSHGWAVWTLDAVLVIGICGLGWWAEHRAAVASE
ncbi:MAG: TerC family protein [Rhodanobacter sp.]|nr:MAG: TerC family protein [Rhodanobacter sp.]TAL90169.1 MAG: TerC family protein [Rhodanobacter sp.]TAM38098.1 MAG: TerC family protein [Rhodanobacter sp.]